jgi:hypothetical protein
MALGMWLAVFELAQYEELLVEEPAEPEAKRPVTPCTTREMPLVFLLLVRLRLVTICRQAMSA